MAALVERLDGRIESLKYSIQNRTTEFRELVDKLQKYIVDNTDGKGVLHAGFNSIEVQLIDAESTFINLQAMQRELKVLEEIRGKRK